MRISFDNNTLFTTGRDGCIYIYEIRDKDPRGGLVKRERGEGAIMQFSDEILTEKPEMDDIYSQRDQKAAELQTLQDPTQADVNEKSHSGDEENINRLKDDLGNQQQLIRDKIQ